jgi:NAD(P)-dependent dehydrogenase (short-subunit alcohol dehydrogenase family)
MKMERQRETDISGKVAIMTGASRGVGKEAALSLARRGAKVVLAARTVDPDPDPTLPGTLGETLYQIEQAGGEALAVATDLAKVEDLQNLVDKTVERFGGVDILINNAAATVGDYWNHTFLELSREDWLYQFDVNVHAPFTLMQLTIPIMEKRGGGRIINITTGSAEVFRLPEETRHKNLGKKNLEVPGYFCPKRALDRLGSIIADNMEQRNVHIIGLMPGWVATEIVQARLEREVGSLDTIEHRPVGMEIPARMIAYFSACENPGEYTGRLFFAERELADMGIEVD